MPFVVATAGLMVTDAHNSRAFGDNDNLSFSHAAANAGVGLMAGGFAVSYLAGHLTANAGALETGLLGAESIADSALAANVIKLATNRRRLDAPGADGDFWSGGKSFPSSHSMITWAAASVFAGRYPDRPLLKWSAYSAATAVSVTRVTGKNHYPSDALVGRYVVRYHGQP